MVEIEKEQEEDRIIIRIIGEVDASSSIKLDQELSEAIENNNNKILVDCEKLEYISSAGLGVFMSYIQVLEKKEIKFVLYNLSSKVKNVFEILGLDQLLPIIGTKEEALQIVNEG
jgi:anti-sigma B factor antagonist